MTVTQFFCRQAKAVELFHGQPDYTEVPAFASPNQDTKVATYSPDGSRFVYTQANSVFIIDANDGSVAVELPVKDVFDVHFSPLGTFLCAWSRPTADQEASNVSIWKTDLASRSGVKVGEYKARNQTGWKPQFTADESLVCRLTSPSELQFYSTAKEPMLQGKALHVLNTKASGKIASYAVSPGKNMSVAVFLPEHSGKPASIRVYNIPNFQQPVSQKQFFKAETCEFKWNGIGTSLLALVSTDVDSSNKSYYGESTLYLMGIIGSFDQRITLDKEGPIHDFSWSTSSREFGVIYGYMPAQTTFFDARGNSIHSLAPSSKNTLAYSPHARYILVAGFGNLQGTVEIYDRQDKFKKIATFEASNTSVCEWSPDGQYIMTATTVPRLRVDNCCKIWHHTGELCYIKEYKELFSAKWRPQDSSLFDPRALDSIKPAQHESALNYLSKRKGRMPNSKEPKGVYRPPHARTAGFKSSFASNSSDESDKSSASSAGGYKPPGARTKVIPGAVLRSSNDPASAAKNRKRKGIPGAVKKTEDKPASAPVSAPSEKPQEIPSESSSQSLAEGNSLEEKKIRALLKKLRAIETLKQKRSAGDHLEETQILKIQTEDKVRSELSSLGWKE
ncbi:Translation initiation factor 2A [Komagataella phaffii CBS 7435]|uniref:Eukaryotic translation initiation factor 2A n=2 Tax=Komagataella phaffii TaxID=460519 RepID=C4R301_KOMPG|nr:Eukaryotic initiation factor (eIF) 2A [Komagataella phaffii GS115]AOA62328.1 GQ67_01293T0 [Komagataella phaffii]CAH2447566.1 Putative translation initiation factor 2A [Komagataella phaffii CBS 7435]AOA67328.1 GQ68_00097T0 [Komagataella phaffii GS115]CAY69875.1 Eukaryotic initiation factor (eIF) 2A [Komagataella phaffii GS115]CCA37757.1 Translation initiation factor 2A [Komagataella phaffii CBS 7435]